MNRALASVVVLLALAPGAHAARSTYFKMVPTSDAASFRTGQRIEPRFSKTLLQQKHAVLVGKKSSNAGAVTEQLFVDTLAQLRKEGKVPRLAPGRTEGVFVTADLDRFPTFRDDPTRSKVTLAPKDPARVATYDRRHFLSALRALERADKGPRADKARHVAAAQRHAIAYYTKAVDLSDPKAEPETLLGGGGLVQRVALRK